MTSKEAKGAFIVQINQQIKHITLTFCGKNTSNDDLNAIATHCPEMEQLDILGTREYTVAGLKNLLQSCKKLKMLDISYCSAEVKSNVSVLRALYPNVEIKCSLPHTSAFDDWHLL
ncbi:UNVERIFIED_CONTAM: Fbxl4 [Trichonephila clavipes]